MPHTWTRMIPLEHVDRCRALMAQHLQLNRGAARKKNKKRINFSQTFMMSFVHAELIIAHLKGTSQREETAFHQRTPTATNKPKQTNKLPSWYQWGPCSHFSEPKTRGGSVTESVRTKRVGCKKVGIKTGSKGC